MQWSSFQSIIQFYAAANLAVIAVGEFKRKEWEKLGVELTSHKDEAWGAARKFYDLSFKCSEVGNKNGREKSRELEKKSLAFEGKFSNGYVFYSGVGGGLSRKEVINNVLALTLSMSYMVVLIHSSFNADNRISNYLAWIISLVGIFPMIFQIILTWSTSAKIKQIRKHYIGNWRIESAELTLQRANIISENCEKSDLRALRTE